MKNFFNKLAASISSTEYYRTVLYQPFWEVFRFYLGFLLLLSVVMTGYYWLSIKPEYENVLNQSLMELSSNYPADLHVDWNGEQLNTSTTPLIVPFPSAAPKELIGQDQYLAVVAASDSATPVVTSLFFITPTQLHTMSEGQLSSGVAIQDILGEESINVNQETLPSFLERVRSFGQMILEVVGYIFPLAAFIFLLLTSFYVLLVETAIIFLLLKLQRSQLSFRQLIQLNMNLLIPAQIISLVTTMAHLDVPVSMLSLSFWILFIFVYFSIQRKIPRSLKT